MDKLKTLNMCDFCAKEIETCGAKIIRAKEKQKKKPPVIIVGLTDSADENVAEECQRSGMNYFLKKPVETKSVVQIIDEVDKAAFE